MVSVGTRSALLGRRRSRSLAALAGAWLLSVAAFGIARGIEEQGRLDEALGPAGLVAAVVVLGLLAGANAYWNGGLAPSMSLVFGPALAGFVHLFGRAAGGRPVETAAIALGAALVFSLPVGGVGHLGGRVARELRRDGAAAEPSWGMRLLVGSDPGRARRWLALAGGLAVAAAVVVGLAHLPGREVARFAVGFFTIATLVDAQPVLAAAGVLGWIGLAAWPAYRGDGALAGWALVFCPVFGATLVSLVADGSGSVVVETAIAALVALGLALLLGTAGNLVGAGARRVRG